MVLRTGFLFLLLLKMFAGDASAQQLGDAFGSEEESLNLPVPAPAPTPSTPAASPEQAAPAGPAIGGTQPIQTWGNNPAQPQEGTFVLPGEEDEESADALVGTEADEPSIQSITPRNPTPQIDRPTLDGSERGRTSMRPILSEGDNEEEDLSDDELIFLYYTDFKVDGMMAGMVNCDVTFVILSTLNRKISSISYTISWPGLSTPVRYENIDPNTETIYKYTLLGEGCYNMDKEPTIRIHTCRVRGLSQEQCKNKVKWITKEK